MTFEEVWNELKSKDTTGVFAKAEELSLVSVEAIEYAFNSGYAEAKAKFERSQGEWIPVSERLPEKMGTYLVTLDYKEHGKGITTLWYHGEGIGWDLRVADVVTAWKPLPEPYKEEGKE